MMMDVNGVVSLLNTEDARRVREIWLMLEQCCNLKGKNTEMPPHFTWQVVERYDFTQFEPQVSALARTFSPFTVRTTGLGIFSGRSPILYISIAKDKNLLLLHEQIWQSSQCCAVNPNLYYAPSYWAPHITLAAGDFDAENLDCAIHQLAFEPFEWEIQVDNFALLCPDIDGKDAFKLWRIPFGGVSLAD